MSFWYKLYAISSGNDPSRDGTTINWIKELDVIRRKFGLTTPTIAVVGDTGSGKSSLLNAVLGYPALLPTSGMRACTAVVVEITANQDDEAYRAEVEFLSKKEWKEERDVILREVAYTDKDGRERFRRPEPGTDAAIGWAKILAVHGRVSWDQKENYVTRALGEVYTIKDADPQAFRKKVETYIDSTDDDEEEDDKRPKFWPIVKLVKMKIPLPNQVGGVILAVIGWF